MSGAEAAGLVLGILPMIFAAVENYEEVLSPLSRYRNFSSKVQRLEMELEVQRTISQTECLLLLAPIVPRDAADMMLNDPTHQDWESKELERRLEQYFSHQSIGNLGKACKIAMNAIRTTMAGLSTKVAELLGAVPARSGNTYGWHKTMRTGLKFSLSDTGIDRLMQDLRRHNDTFRALSNQIDRIRDRWPTPKRSTQTGATHSRIARMRLVREKSMLLYTQLAQACSVHPKHDARVALPIDMPTSSSTDSSAIEVCFRLAFMETETRAVDAGSCVSTVAAGSLSHPSMSSEQSIHELGRQTRENLALAKHLKKAASPAPDTSWLRCVFANMNPSNASTFPGSSSLSSTSQDRSCLAGALPLKFRPADINITTVRPLAEYLDCDTNTYRRTLSLPLWRRVSIAKCLALTVLELQSTPWLRKPLTNETVHLSMGHGTGDPSNVAGADHLTILNTSIDRQEATDEASRALSMPSGALTSGVRLLPGIIRNVNLFTLGVLFLELGHGATLIKLRQSVSDILPLDDTAASQMLLADYFADTVSTHLGSEYATLTRQCLACDFGCGSNLLDPKLEAKVFGDVVCKLEELEAGFRLLQLGP